MDIDNELSDIKYTYTTIMQIDTPLNLSVLALITQIYALDIS
jgi:hypothetical protein